MGITITPICIADGPTLQQSGAASCIPRTCAVTLPAGYFALGRKFHLSMAGKLSTAVLDASGAFDESPGSARFDLRLNGTVVWDTGAIVLNPLARAVNLPWSLTALIDCVSVGVDAATTFRGAGTFACAAITGAPASQPRASAIAALPWGTPPAAGLGVNAFTPLSVDVFFTQTSARGSLTVSQYAIEEL